MGPDAVQGFQAEGLIVAGNPCTGLEMTPPAQGTPAVQGIGQERYLPMQDFLLDHKLSIHGTDGVTIPLGCHRAGQAGA